MYPFRRRRRVRDVAGTPRPLRPISWWWMVAAARAVIAISWITTAWMLAQAGAR